MPRSRYVWKQYRKFETIVLIYTGRKNDKNLQIYFATFPQHCRPCYCRCYFLPIFVCPRKGRGKNQEAPRAWDFRRYKNVPRNLCGINDVFTSMFSRAACRWEHRYVDTTELPTQQPRITNTGYANYPHRPAIIPITNQ